MPIPRRVLTKLVPPGIPTALVAALLVSGTALAVVLFLGPPTSQDQILSQIQLSVSGFPQQLNYSTDIGKWFYYNVSGVSSYTSNQTGFIRTTLEIACGSVIGILALAQWNGTAYQEMTGVTSGSYCQYDNPAINKTWTPSGSQTFAFRLRWADFPSTQVTFKWQALKEVV